MSVAPTGRRHCPSLYILRSNASQENAWTTSRLDCRQFVFTNKKSTHFESFRTLEALTRKSQNFEIARSKVILRHDGVVL